MSSGPVKVQRNGLWRIIITLAAILVLIVAGARIRIWFAHASTQEKILASETNLHNIGISILNYANHNNGDLPPDLGALASESPPNYMIFFDPQNVLSPPNTDSINSLADLHDWINSHADYAYCGAGYGYAKLWGVPQVRRSETVIAYEKDSARIGDAVNVLYLDFHVGRLPVDKARQAISASATRYAQPH
jgi:prepilin-type processing-associated H-X9-DG protein